jgi:hypothetical protein
MPQPPAMVAYLVTEPASPRQRGLSGAGFYYGSDPGPNASWREIGHVWRHRNGNGFDLVIHPGLAAFGRIVIVDPDNKPADRSGGEWPRS